ncbi:Gfo/Idh/MocA family protein [Rhizobium halophytocola]
MVMTAVLSGCGSMARGWLRAILDNPDLSQRVRLRGLVDLDIDAARRLAAEFELGDVVIGTDLAAVLEETGAEILFDVVVPPARSTVVEIGLAHGCHVLSEKPLASSMAEAEALIALAGQAERIHAVVQNRRFIPGVRRLRRAVAEGLIGDLTAIHGDFFLGPHFGGFREAMDNVLLLDMAIHTFDAARFISAKQPQSVYCLETNPAGSWYRHGAAADAIFQMSDGCVFTYRGSWCAPGQPTSWESRWRLVGTKGMITWDGAETFEATIAGKEPGLLPGHVAVDVPAAPEDARTLGHASVIADFIDAIGRGGAPETVSSDNIKSLAMVFGAIESARTGMPVSIAA